MNQDLHNMDELLNSAYQRFEEEPSSGLWDKINADLDKKDAEKYKKRSVGWKRIAIILILLLSGFVLYESGVIKTGSGSRNYNKAERKNSAPAGRSIPGDNAANTPSSQNKNTNDNYSNPPPDKGSNTAENNKNIFEENTTRQITIPDNVNKKNKIITKEKPAVANQNVFISNTVNKNKAIPKLLKLISDKQHKSDKIPGNELLVAKQNSNKPKVSVTDINNILVSSTADIETPPIKKIIRIPAGRMLPGKDYALPELSGKPLLLNIPDSVLLKNLVKQPAKKTKAKFKPYWTITGFASTDWAQYKLDNNVPDNNGQSVDERQVIAKRERHESSFSAGVMATWQFNKHTGIKTGLIYSNTAIIIDPQKMYAAQKTDGSIAYKYISSSGYAYVKPDFGLPPAIGDSLNATSAQHNLQVLSIPILLTYKIEKKKFSITPSAGITANFITKATIQTDVEDALDRETVTINGLNGLKKFHIGFMADVNLQYNFNKRWAVNLLPTFRYAISPITKSNVVKTYPYSFGLGLGFTYKF